jgi:hypothetical protein
VAGKSDGGRRARQEIKMTNSSPLSLWIYSPTFTQTATSSAESCKSFSYLRLIFHQWDPTGGKVRPNLSLKAKWHVWWVRIILLDSPGLYVGGSWDC